LKELITVLREYFPESTFIEYKNFYDDYFNYRLKNVSGGSSVKRTNALLKCKKEFNKEDFFKLSLEDKKYQLNVFFETYIRPTGYIDIYPMIFHWDTYVKWAKDLSKSTTCRIIIGESLNKLAPIMDHFDDHKTYLIPFSKNIFLEDLSTLKHGMKQYLSRGHLAKYKSLLQHQCGLTDDILDRATTITLMDYVESGNGFVSFVTIFLLMFPHLHGKLRLRVVAGYIPELDGSNMYFQPFGPKQWALIKSRFSIPFKIIVYKCNRYVFDVFTQEYYENRLFISLPIQNVVDGNMSIFYKYNGVHLNRLVRFFIFYKLFE
jgi:hypothetical protein